MSKIYEQINPDSLGQDFRDLSVATKYSERLSKRSCNIKDDGIRRLVNEYPSHDFVIDVEEAKEIFNNVELPSGTLYKLMVQNLKDLIEPNDSKDSIIRMTTIENSQEDHVNANTESASSGSKNGTSAGDPGGEATAP